MPTNKSMTRIEDFCNNLFPESGEIKIPKNLITEHLVGWTQALLYLPKQGSLASYRKGRLHAHDMGDCYHVHVDKVDPSKDPLGHLIEDAPQVIVAGVIIGALFLYYLAIRDSKKKYRNNDSI